MSSRIAALSGVTLLSSVFLAVSVNGIAVSASENGENDGTVQPQMGHALFMGRIQRRAELLEENGGTEETEAAVKRGLEWIASQQHEDGSWDFADDPVVGGGRGFQMPSTAFALLAFQGAGHSHQHGEHADNVKRGVTWLLEHQRETGQFHGSNLYVHAICSLAVADLLGLTSDPELKPAVEKAVEFSVEAQDPVGGGWRYMPKTAGDTSVTGWFVAGLCSAREAGVEVPEKTFELANSFLDSAQSDEGTLYSYIPGSGPTPSMTAVGHLSRQWLQVNDKPEVRVTGLAGLSRSAGFEIDEPDFYYWYHASQAFRNVGGESWRSWNESMQRDLIEAQESRGEHSGSWSPEDGKWAKGHGRLFATCLAVLSLEVYYRHDWESVEE